MTRQEILDAYTVSKYGHIQSPGKFEGEMLYAPYFHEQDGEELSYMEDGCGEYVYLVDVTDEDRTEFPELGDARYVLVIESEHGFVSVARVADEESADRLRAAYDNSDESEEDSSY
jgi:hypothetical protein